MRQPGAAFFFAAWLWLWEYVSCVRVRVREVWTAHA
jgi:hypothetical protein